MTQSSFAEPCSFSATYAQSIAEIWSVNGRIGLGFFIDERTVVTCAHVVRAAGSDLRIRVPQGERLTHVALCDDACDVALLQLDISVSGYQLLPLELYAGATIGAKVVFVGWSVAQTPGLERGSAQLHCSTIQTISTTVVKGNKGAGGAELYELAGDCQPGYSGGPVVLEGETRVCGMVVARDPTAHHAFAVPGQHLADCYRRYLKDNGGVGIGQSIPRPGTPTSAGPHGSSKATEPVEDTLTLALMGNSTSKDLRSWPLITIIFILASGLVWVMTYLFADPRKALLHGVLAWVVVATAAVIGIAALGHYLRTKANTDNHVVEINRNGVRIRVLGPAALGMVVSISIIALVFWPSAPIDWQGAAITTSLPLTPLAPTAQDTAPALTIAPTPTAEPSSTTHDSHVSTKASTSAAVRPTSGSRPNRSSPVEEKPLCQSVGARRPTALAIDPTGANERTYQEPDVWEIVRASCQAKEGRKAKANSWTITRAGVPFECFCRD